MANPANRLLVSYFPDVKPMLLLAITNHEFDLGQLFKIDPSWRTSPGMATCSCQRQAFWSRLSGMHPPRNTHLSIPCTTPPHLFQHLATPIDHLWEPTSPHWLCTQLQQIDVRPLQTVPQIRVAPVAGIPLQIHNRHIIKMQEGKYSGWEHVDANLMSLHQSATPKPCQPSKALSQHGQDKRMCQNNFVTHLHLENARCHASQGESTGATNAAPQITMHHPVQRWTRTVAGWFSSL